jgi:long-subunit acyl-CoA synthetase (AMP-forming)
VTTAGERGELYVRGPQVCLGYWKNEEATRETLDEEGWLKTGDVALFDEKGWFWIVDRKKVRFEEGVERRGCIGWRCGRGWGCRYADE